MEEDSESVIIPKNILEQLMKQMYMWGREDALKYSITHSSLKKVISERDLLQFYENDIKNEILKDLGLCMEDKE